MRTTGVSVLVALACVTTVVACSQSSSRTPDTEPRVRVDRNRITREQLQERRFLNAGEAIEAMRPNWIADRGPTSFGDNQAVVQIYLDGVRLGGGAAMLRTIPTTNIYSLQFIDGVTATQRWGLDHGRGVVFVATRPATDALAVLSNRRLEPVDTTVLQDFLEVGNPAFDWFEYTGNDVALQANTNRAIYQNPILAGFYPDPSITRRGDDYYIVTSSFSYFPGVPIFHSRDLVNWTQVGFVLSRPSQLPLDSAGVSRGIFAPTIRYDERTKLFYMITTLIDQLGNFLVTAEEPAGPWSEPVPLGFDGIDPDIFFDDDGRVWISNNGPPNETPRYSGHRAIWIQEYDPRAKRMLGPRTQIVNGGVDITTNPIWIEAPHIYKVDGWYYLLCAEGGTADQHSAVIFRSRSVTGPYEPGPVNPILTQRHLDPARANPVTTAGHADFVQTPAGDWWAVFLATRPYGGVTPRNSGQFNTGRETFLLPVEWKDGWPMILAGDATVPYAGPRPRLAATEPPAIPTQGNFTYRDEFETSALRQDWQFLRTPREQWYSLNAAPGALAMLARPAAITERTQPSALLRRQQHLNATATASMKYRPARNGDKAGLLFFQNERYFYLLSVTQMRGQRVIQLEKADGGAPTVVGSVALSNDIGTTILLRGQANGANYEFSYSAVPGVWERVGGVQDGSLLSTARAQGFVGAMIGLYAYRDR